MDKHRKAESRRVKSYVRILRAVGCETSYKKARRHIRKRDRDMRNLPKNVNRGLRKGIKRCNYIMRTASGTFARLTEHVAVLGRTSMHPLGISAVSESLALHQEAFTEQKLSEDRPIIMSRNSDYVFLDKAVLAVETPALWPRDNPHIKKEVLE